MVNKIMFDGMNAALGVTLVSGIMLVIINAFYRFLVNQDKAGALKARMQELSAEMKKNPDKQKELMSETMSSQREMMKMNMKPMLLSFAIVALLLPWLGGYYHDVNVNLVNNTASFVLSANGNYSVNVLNGSAVISGSGTQLNCQMPCNLMIAGNSWDVSQQGDVVRFALIAARLPDGLPLIGGLQLGWIWWYLLVSIPLAIIIRAAYGIRA